MSTELLPITELSPSERSFELQQALYRSKGIEVDVFGVPVAEAERYEPGEVRVIPITDEILAAEAAAQAARQTDREKLTWYMPEPLPDTAYRPRPGKRRLRLAPAPKPAKAAKAAKMQPVVPPPAQVHKEELPMEKHLEEKTCIVASCSVALKANNASGRCTKHGYLKQGTVLKDGTIIGKGASKGVAMKPSAKKPVTSAPPSVTKSRALDKTVAAITGAGVVLLPVPETMLTDFWHRLDVADKVRIISTELQRGL